MPPTCAVKRVCPHRLQRWGHKINSILFCTLDKSDQVLAKTAYQRHIWFVKLFAEFVCDHTEKIESTLFVEHLIRVQRHEERRHDTRERFSLPQKQTLVQSVSRRYHDKAVCTMSGWRELSALDRVQHLPDQNFFLMIYLFIITF